MDFLTANTQNVLDGEPNANFVSAEGKDVVVIGGGDTGTDCVGTSMRHGCRSLVQLEILPKPPMSRALDNPWPQWPKVYRLDYGQEEALAVFGSDPRVYCTTAKKFVGDDDGHVKEVHTVQIDWQKDEKGRFVPVEVPGTEKVSPAQLVLLAMGFLGPEDTAARAARRRARRALQRQGRIRPICDQHPRRLRGGRCPARPEPGRLGLQRGPRRGPRMRPLPDGRNEPALAFRYPISLRRRCSPRSRCLAPRL